MAEGLTSQLTAIAVIGVSCQLPAGVEDTASLFDYCAKAKCSARSIPEDRFQTKNYYHPATHKKGHFNVRGGSFLDRDVSSFDASFFNLTAADAIAMDPQQRLLLECAFTAVENAGLDVNELFGRPDVGVFAGGSKSDYHDLTSLDQFTATRYAATGNALSMFANRVSYFFNWRGPSLTVDTACSSSLTAVHLAVESLRRGECSIALVGGSFLQLSPLLLSQMAAIGAVSMDGISHAFDSRANGYGRGEGSGCLVLRRAEDAKEAGNAIRAIIRNTGTNHCGRSQGGITVPSQKAQAELIRDVYASAGLDPRETAFVECHGTGTNKGDPIEARSIAYSFDAPSLAVDKPLYIGSAKSNFGHLEGGSGIVSILKAIAMLETGTILPNANFLAPNPDIDFEVLGLKVPTVCNPWPEGKAKRISINNFGFGGSNAHAILESPTSSQFANGKKFTRKRQTSHVYVISAKSEVSLQRMISALLEYVMAKDADDEHDFLRDLSATLLGYRSQFKHTWALVASTRQQLIERLTACVSGVRRSSKGPLTFIFTGQGAQWARNGMSLMVDNRYNAAMQEADRYLRSLGAPWSLIDEIAKPEATSRIGQAAISQPATTAMQVALVMALESRGLRPTSVCGHSSGELAAAYTAGILDFHSCLAVAYYRGVAASQLEADATSGKGAMMAIGTDVQTIRPLLSSLTSGVATIACFNSLQSLTISGDVAAIHELKKRLDDMEIFARILRVRTAYHSDHMYQVVDRYLHDLNKILASCENEETRSPVVFYSSVTTSAVHPKLIASSTYWAMNLVCPVQFSQTLQSMLDAAKSETPPGHPPTIVEIGPHAALRGPVREIVAQRSPGSDIPAALYLPSLQRKEEGLDNFHVLLANLINLGHPVKVKNIISAGGPGPNGKLLTDLPSYQFDRARYWHKSRVQTAALQGGSPWNVMLGHRVSAAVGDDLQFRHVFALDDVPWLGDHQVEGNVIFPMAVYISAVIEALNYKIPEGKRAGCAFNLREVVISKAFIISDEDDNEMFTTLRPDRTETRSSGTAQSFTFEVLSWTNRTGFVEHCRGLARLTPAGPMDHIGEPIGRALRSEHAQALQSRIQSSCTREVSADELYEAAARCGLQYGPAFQGATGMKTGACAAYGRLKSVDLSERMPAKFESSLVVHPAWLDAALHVGLCNLGGNKGDPAQIRPNVPTFLEDLRLQLPSNHDLSSCQAEVYVHNVHASATASSTVADISVFYSGEDKPTVELRGLRMFQTSDAVVTPEASDPEIINPCTVEWLPHPDFATSLHAVTDTLSTLGLEEEQSRRQELSRSSIYWMVDALAATSKPPQAVHLRKLYDWMQRVTHPDESDANDSGPLAWLASDAAERKIFQEQFSTRWPDSSLWTNVGAKLPMILREEIGPLEVLMQDNMLFNIYEQSPIFQRSFRHLAALVDSLSQRNPWLRILEVGAGTGGCTSRVLNRITLPTARFETYDYTDISSGFFEAARAKFPDAGGRLNFRKLDICADVEEQGFTLGSYDLVIAADVIHATPSIQDSLSNIRKLLKPTGRLAMVELSSITPYMFAFATLPGWWYRGDDNGAFVPEDEWQRLLVASGFEGIEASLKDLPRESKDHMHSVIWSRPFLGNVAVPRTVTVLDDSHEQGDISHDLADQLSRAPGIENVVIDALASCEHSTGPFVFLQELHRPLLAMLTSEELMALQKLFTSATEVLWVVKGSTGAREADRALYDFAFGFARSVRREHAALKFIVVQIEECDQDAYLSDIVSVFKHCFLDHAGHHDMEVEYNIKNGVIRFARLVQHPQIRDSILQKAGDVKTEERLFAQEDQPLQLDMSHAGSLDGLIFRAPSWMTEGRPLGDDELMIKIKATGLNFKDVLIALGSLPWQGLGRECCGVVVAVGPTLSSEFRVGDTVLHWGTNLFASHARCGPKTFTKAPSHLSLAEAATVPVVYSTAYECLVNVAHLKEGEKILIHAAAGGVGQAAIMLATWVGADIYCTVGTPDKKSLLMSKYGIREDHIFSSRSTSFADSLLLATDHRGVDVVLNSLSDEMYQSTWKCLSFFGRFVDIGKKHFVSNAKLELNPFDKSITYASVDLSLLIEHRPAYVQNLISDVVDLFDKSILQPPTPVHQTPVSDVQAAFRTMQSGRVVGKTVIVNDYSSVVTAEVRSSPKASIRGDASYLITGGTGGLGLALTQWLIEMGARYVVLISRSGGDQTAGSPLSETVAWAKQQGAQVLLSACDVSNAVSMNVLLCTLAEQRFPVVAGVIHGAMVLKDSLFEKATLADWAAVVNPKVQGALNLHRALSRTALDFFLCLSSSVAICGNVGQSSYSGSNAFLDAFCRYRHQQGLPATSVNLPAISEIGYVADAVAGGRGKVMENFYAAAMSQSQLISVLESAIAVTSSRCAATPTVSSHVVAGLAALPERAKVYQNSGPLLNLLYRATEAKLLHSTSSSGANNTAAKPSLKQLLVGADLADSGARDVLFTGIAEKVSSILMVPLDDIKPHTSLDDLGLDSLIAVELRNWLVRELGVSISVIEIANSASIRDLADQISTRIVI